MHQSFCFLAFLRAYVDFLLWCFVFRFAYFLLWCFVFRFSDFLLWCFVFRFVDFLLWCFIFRFVDFLWWCFVLRLKLISALPDSKYDTPYKSGQNWLTNNVLSLIIDFTNISQANFMVQIPILQKKRVKLSAFFALLGSAHTKTARRKFLKLTPDHFEFYHHLDLSLQNVYLDCKVHFWWKSQMSWLGPLSLHFEDIFLQCRSRISLASGKMMLNFVWNCKFFNPLKVSFDLTCINLISNTSSLFLQFHFIFQSSSNNNLRYVGS